MAFVTTGVVEVRAWGRHGRSRRADASDAFLSSSIPAGALSIEISRRAMPVADAAGVPVPRPRNAQTWAQPARRSPTRCPTAFGNADHRRGVRSGRCHPRRGDRLDRLVYTGSRAMGALEFVPDTVRADPPPTTSTWRCRVARDVRRGPSGFARSTTALEQISRSAPAQAARAPGRIQPRPPHSRRCGRATARGGVRGWLLKFDGIAPTVSSG